MTKPTWTESHGWHKYMHNGHCVGELIPSMVGGEFVTALLHWPPSDGPTDQKSIVNGKAYIEQSYADAIKSNTLDESEAA